MFTAVSHLDYVANYCARVLRNTSVGGIHFALVYKLKTDKGSYFLPQFFLEQPCGGEMGFYEKVHGEGVGFPNAYRPNDLFCPRLTESAVRVFIRTCHSRKQVEGLFGNKKNPWKSAGGFVAYYESDVCRPEAGGVVELDAKGNPTVLVNFMRACRYGTKEDDLKKGLSFALGLSTQERFNEADPILYLPDPSKKTLGDGSNYYRGGMSTIFAPISHTAFTKTG